MIPVRSRTDSDLDREKWSFARGSYDNFYSKYEKSGGTTGASDRGPENETDEPGTKFALEEQLRDYLAENLGILEAGLSLWPIENGDAVEFQVDEQGPSRRIDILAKDRGGLPVVIELKVSRGVTVHIPP